MACALRYFAGGSPYHIAPLFEPSYSEVISSFWIIVHALNSCPDFHISYPESLEAQQKIAADSQSASTPGIGNCAGAIDGILIWMLKPSLKEVKLPKSVRKFVYGQKHNFGLNC